MQHGHGHSILITAIPEGFNQWNIVINVEYRFRMTVNCVHIVESGNTPFSHLAYHLHHLPLIRNPKVVKNRPINHPLCPNYRVKMEIIVLVFGHIQGGLSHHGKEIEMPPMRCRHRILSEWTLSMFWMRLAGGRVWSAWLERIESIRTHLTSV